MITVIRSHEQARALRPSALGRAVDRAMNYLASARQGGWTLGLSRPFDWASDVPYGEMRSWPVVCGRGRGEVMTQDIPMNTEERTAA